MVNVEQDANDCLRATVDSIAIMPTLLDSFRTTRHRTTNLARFLNPLLIVTLLTVLFLGWVAFRWGFRPSYFQTLPQNIIELLDLYEFGSTVTLILLWGIVLWRRRKPRRHKTKTPTVDQLYALDPYQFEEYVAAVFRKKGYQVAIRGGSGDKGVDLVVETGAFGKRAIVQCKRYRNKIGPETVRELYGTLLHERAAHAFLVTTAEISDSAREWAQHKSLTLIDGETLVRIAQSLDGV
jgi:restriction system protein